MQIKFLDIFLIRVIFSDFRCIAKDWNSDRIKLLVGNLRAGKLLNAFKMKIHAVFSKMTVIFTPVL